MTTLVIGAGGFLGRAVIEAAAGSGRELRAHLGPDDAPLPDAPGGVSIPTARVDLRRADAAAALADLAAGAEVIVHLAGIASVASSFNDPAAHVATHVGGTSTVVDVCRAAGVARLVYISSAEVYGRPDRSPVAEGAALAPRSPYAAAKVGAEALIGAACRTGDLDAIVLRPFSIYGPGARRGSVLGTIIDQALGGGDVLLNDLRPVRDYCEVGDVARAVWLAVDSTRDGAAGATSEGPAACNVGTGVGTSVADLARAVLDVVGSSACVAARDEGDRPPTADIPELVADVARAQELLGWAATTPLHDGLTATVRAWTESAA